MVVTMLCCILGAITIQMLALCKSAGYADDYAEKIYSRL